MSVTREDYLTWLAEASPLVSRLNLDMGQDRGVFVDPKCQADIDRARKLMAILCREVIEVLSQMPGGLRGPEDIPPAFLRVRPEGWLGVQPVAYKILWSAFASKDPSQYPQTLPLALVNGFGDLWKNHHVVERKTKKTVGLGDDILSGNTSVILVALSRAYYSLIFYDQRHRAGRVLKASLRLQTLYDQIEFEKNREVIITVLNQWGVPIVGM